MPEDIPLELAVLIAVIGPTFTLIGGVGGSLLQYFTTTTKVAADSADARRQLDRDREREERLAQRERNRKLADDAFAFIQVLREMHRIQLTLGESEPVMLDSRVVDTGTALAQRDKLLAECWGWMMVFTASDPALGRLAQVAISRDDIPALEKQILNFRYRLGVICKMEEPT